MEYSWLRSTATGLLVVIFGCAPICASSPGFGTLRKKEIELKVRQPAAVRLANTSIALTGKVSNSEYGSVKDTLLATLETELIANENTLIVREKSSEAEWVISVDVTGYSLPQSQRRTATEGKSVETYVRWTGSLNAAYRVLDQNGRVHDAGNVDTTYDREFSSSSSGSVLGHLPFGMGHNLLTKNASSAKTQGPPATQDQVKQILVKDVVSQIATKLGNTAQMIRVQVPGGEEHLDRAATFMGDKLWSRASDELERAPLFTKPEDESYRQYDLGLVYEAIAYDSKSASEQRTNIFKAAEYYDKALELNPGQKYFVDTVARSKDAIARFKALDAMQRADEKAVQQAKVGNSSSGRSGGAAGASGKALTAADVVQMYSLGVDEEQIRDAIDHAATLHFDPYDKDTMLLIAKSKLPRTIQNEMRKKIGAPPLRETSPQAVAVKSAKKT